MTDDFGPKQLDPQLASSLARRFRLVRQLGAGGMGAVFLAEQIAVGNRPVALKVLSRKLLDDPDFLLRSFVAASLPRHGGVKPPLRKRSGFHGAQSSQDRRHHLRILPGR
jgi:serine/threonine protein kinase